MKIVCSLWEFAVMVRNCEYYKEKRGCEGCVLFGTGYCGPDKGEGIETNIEFEITDRAELGKIIKQ